MSGFTRRLARLVMVAGVVVPLGVVAASDARAAAPADRCWGVHDISSELCTRWNGGYPSGSVWAEAGRDYYALRLMVCPGCEGPTGWKWLVAASATNHPGRTPAVRAGKTSWYKVCGKLSEYSVDWFCMPNSEAVYLGD